MAGRYRILIAAEDAELRRSAALALGQGGSYECLEATTREQAVLRLAAGGVHLAIADLGMARGEGRPWFDELHGAAAGVPILIVSSLGTIEAAVELLERGACDYLTRPFKTEELEARVRRAAERLSLPDPVRTDDSRIAVPAVAGLVGRSEAMDRVLRQIPSIARSEASVILYGESGTGKELVARAVHAMSPRGAGPFVTVNCGALPETLLENELFGHLRGAYTDAREDHPGLIQEADGGTLLLDEIGEMSPATQVKLLRFLQEKEYRPLGATRTIKANVRVVAATNRDLQQLIAAGSFREDLYYRLNIIPLTLPPLRERKEDIPLLVAHFLRRQVEGTSGRVEGISPLALRKLMSHDWPGNVRELENKLQQVVALATGTEIQPEQIELPVSAAIARADGRLKSFKEAKREVVAAFEIGYVTRLLALTNGNISEAARLARKHRRAFWEIMKKHGLCGRLSSADAIPAEAPAELETASV